MTKNRFQYLPLALVLAALAIAYVFLGADAVAATGLMLANAPFGIAKDLPLNEIVLTVAEKNEAHHIKTDQAISDLRSEIERVERNGNVRGLFGGAARPGPGRFLKSAVTGREYPFLSSKESLAAGHEANGEDFDLGQYVAAAIAGGKVAGKAVATGPALVAGTLAAQIIDDVRAQTTVVQAGAGTIVIGGPTVVGRITGDPTVYQHTEGASDITPSDMTVDGVTMDPKALVAIVPITGEVTADSANLDTLLRQSLAAAFAVRLDALALARIIADTNVPKSSVAQDPIAWVNCLAAVGQAMGAKQPLPASMITSAADFIARASEQASTAGSWLGKPPALSAMMEYPTTALAAGTAVYGGFSEGFAIALRQELRVEVIRWHEPEKYTHALVAHMRADGVMLQPKRLFKQLKVIT